MTCVPMSHLSTNTVTLVRAGELIHLLEDCMAARLAPGRSGWSQAHHLRTDLDRLLGVQVPDGALDRALRQLSRRGQVVRRMDEDGHSWFKLIRPARSITPPGSDAPGRGR